MINREQLGSLVEFLDAQDCDNTPRRARRWAAEHGIDWKELETWLEDHGGFCDCEIVMNCEPRGIFP